MSGLGQIQGGPNLGRVVMPLVRLLAKDGLSWADREAIVSAIQHSMRIHADMESEAAHLGGAKSLRQSMDDVAGKMHIQAPQGSLSRSTL